MLIEKIPKKEPYDSEGRFIRHNLEKSIVTMTRDEAVRLVRHLVAQLGTPNRHDLSCDPFPDGLWEEKEIAFCVVDEPTFIKYRQEFRDEKEQP